MKLGLVLSQTEPETVSDQAVSSTTSTGGMTLPPPVVAFKSVHPLDKSRHEHRLVPRPPIKT
ncbi:MAG: hypothetical protein Q7S40_04540 [Opitutaceae bacterium]|nr:hypothetical protein [Opitutaceae bacterium]